MCIRDRIQSVDPAGNRTSLTYGNFLSLSEGTLIYWVSENEGNAVRLDAVELDGSGQRTLASFSIAQWSNMGGPAFTVQTVDDTVYFFFGIYGGTGMFLQEGRDVYKRQSLQFTGLSQFADREILVNAHSSVKSTLTERGESTWRHMILL